MKKIISPKLSNSILCLVSGFVALASSHLSRHRETDSYIFLAIALLIMAVSGRFLSAEESKTQRKGVILLGVLGCICVLMLIVIPR